MKVGLVYSGLTVILSVWAVFFVDHPTVNIVYLLMGSLDSLENVSQSLV